jgi:RNA polymerase sigma-70 factor (ECF subfamily)
MPGEVQPDVTDARLLTAAAEGDRDAYRVFVRRHQAALFRYAQVLTAREADAEDVLQRAFLAAWRAAGQARREGAEKAWLRTILRHEAQRFGRLRAGQESRDVSFEALGEAAGFAAEGDPERSLALAEQREQLTRALSALPPDDQEVMVLYELDGLTADEVASVRGESRAAIKSRVHRARLRLLAALQEGGCDAWRA